MLSLLVATSLSVNVVYSRSQPISYETRGKDVVQIVRDLADLTKLDLATDGLRDWPLILRLKNRPANEVLALIASLTDSEWVSRDGKSVLTRSEARRRRAALSEAVTRGERMKHWLIENHGLDQPLRDWTDVEAAAAAKESELTARAVQQQYGRGGSSYGSGFMENTPAKIILLDFLRLVKPELLGSIQGGEHLAFSTTPGRNEKPMPVNLDPATAAFLRSRSKLAAKVPIEDYDFGSGMSIKTNALLSHRPVPSKIAIGIQLSRQAHPGALIRASITVSGSAILDHTGLSINMPSATEEKMPDFKGEVRLSPDSVSLLQASQARIRSVAVAERQMRMVFLSGGYSPPRSPALQAILRQPVLHEPHSFFAADWLFASADSIRSELAATVPDNLISTVAGHVAKTNRLETIWKAFEKLDIKAEVKAGILIVRPRDLARIDQFRVDRAALQKFFATFGSDRLPTIEEKSTYAVTQSPIYSESNLDFFWMRLLDPNALAFQTYDPSFLRLYATLPSDQKLAKRVTIEATKVSPAQKSLLDRILSSGSNLGGFSGNYASSGPISDPQPIEIRAFDFPTVTVLRNPAPTFLVDFADGSQARLNEENVAVRLKIARGSSTVSLTPIKSFREIYAESFMLQADKVISYHLGVTHNAGLGPVEFPNRLSAAMTERLKPYMDGAYDVRRNDFLPGGVPPPQHAEKLGVP